MKPFSWWGFCLAVAVGLDLGLDLFAPSGKSPVASADVIIVVVFGVKLILERMEQYEAERTKGRYATKLGVHNIARAKYGDRWFYASEFARDFGISSAEARRILTNSVINRGLTAEAHPHDDTFYIRFHT